MILIHFRPLKKRVKEFALCEILRRARYLDKEVMKDRMHKIITMIDPMALLNNNGGNITVTLSTRKGVAQPWRFFFACKKCLRTEQGI